MVTLIQIAMEDDLNRYIEECAKESKVSKQHIITNKLLKIKRMEEQDG